MRSQKHIVCIGFWSEYDRQFFESVHLKGYEVLVINPIEQLGKRIPPALLVKPLRTFLLKVLARHYILKHKEEHILIHDERVMTGALLSIKQKLDAGVLMRNILSDNRKVGKTIVALQRKGYPVWSFDTADCEKYDFQLYRQFISKVGNYEDTPIKLDFVFLGKDKGRKPTLDKLQQQLQEMGFRCDIDLRVGDRKKGSGQIDKSYHDYLTQICSAACIIDIVQGEQSGMTLRPLEAALYQRKLLTNNTLVQELPFYHPNNVFILGQDSIDNLNDFMTTAFVQPSDEAVNSYLTESMLQKVVFDNRPSEIQTV